MLLLLLLLLLPIADDRGLAKLLSPGTGGGRGAGGRLENELERELAPAGALGVVGNGGATAAAAAVAVDGVESEMAEADLVGAAAMAAPAVAAAAAAAVALAGEAGSDTAVVGTILVEGGNRVRPDPLLPGFLVGLGGDAGSFSTFFSFTAVNSASMELTGGCARNGGVRK